MQKIAKIIKISKNDINFIFNHEELFCELDSSLLPKFGILQAYKQREILDNENAIQIYKDIISSQKVNKILNDYDEYNVKLDLLQDKINIINSLIYGEKYDSKLILDLCDKYKFNDQDKRYILFYPIIISSRKNIKERIANKDNEEIIDTNDNHFEKSYEDEFQFQVERFKKIKDSYSQILSKYYQLIAQMNPSLFNYYKNYIDIKEEYNINDFYESYEDVVLKIKAITLFEDKSEIEIYISDLMSEKVKKIDDVELLESYINDFENNIKELIELDKSEDELDNEKTSRDRVFFALDQKGNLLMPYSVEDSKIFLNILDRVDSGSLLIKNGSNVKHLKGAESAEKLLNKTIFLLSCSGKMFSYIKFNDKENNELIMILTYALEKSNSICNDTISVVRHNIDSILSQIKLIQNMDQDYLNEQNIIKESIIGDKIDKKIG